MINHGGDIYRNKVDIDFSVNVNPLGPPKSVMEAAREAVIQCDVYPDLMVEALRNGLAKIHDVQAGQILCGNGASEILMAVMHAIRPKQVLIPVPSFSGYQWVMQAVGADAVFYKMKEEYEYQLDDGILQVLKEDRKFEERRDDEASESIDMLILANPNNPVGNYIDYDLLTRILDICEEKRIWVLLDECFMELSTNPDKHSRIQDLKYRNRLLIVRAFTKSFAIPALRLGYLLGSAESANDCGEIEKDIKLERLTNSQGSVSVLGRIKNDITSGQMKDSQGSMSVWDGAGEDIVHLSVMEKIRRQLPEWNVSLLAQLAGLAALGEEKYLREARQLICEEREYLSKQLSKLSIRVYPSETNYLFFYMESQTEEDKNHFVVNYAAGETLDHELLKCGILIRSCRDYPGLGEGYYRIAVRTHGDNEALVKALYKLL